MDTTRRRLFELGKRIRTGAARADFQCATRPYEPGRPTQRKGHYEERQSPKQKRERSRRVRSTTEIPTKNDDRTKDPMNDHTNNEKQRQSAPYHYVPTYRDSTLCLLTAAHYVVSCSIGLDGRTMLPFNAVLDTGSGMNIVRRDTVTDGWETLLTKEAVLPTLGDANRRPLRFLGEIVLRLRFGNTTYRVPFIVAEKLGVEVIVGTRFMNRYVTAIVCRSQTIGLHVGSAIPILSRHDARRPLERPNDKPNENNDTPNCPRNDKRINDAPFNKTHTIRTARTVTIPPMSQVAIPAVTKASGLVYIKPKLPVQTRYEERTANGIHDVRPDVRFDVVLANFSKAPKRLPKGMTIAYEKWNPLAILKVPNKASAKIYAEPNLPFTKTTANDHKNNESIRTNGPDEPMKPTDCRETIDLGHIDDNEMRTKILTMLTTHEDMWTTGRLGEITAMEHRITLQPGTKHIRSMPYRQGPAIRTRAEAEIQRMGDAGVIEPATSEWASPIVLVTKKDGSLRFCVDYRRLNAKTFPDAYPLPRIDGCLDSLGDAEIFTTLDCNAGYWQVPVAPEDRDKTTFTSYIRTFRYTRMTFGLRNAPATFQRALDIILSGVRWKSCLIYLDDVIVCGRRYLEPATGVATMGWTGCSSRHPRPRGDGGDSCRRRLGYEESDAGQG